jgi:hypothetical protein
MRRTFTYLLAASIALSGSTIGFTGASAAVPRLSAPAAVETGNAIEQVDRRGSRHKWKKYSRSRHHDRHYSKRHRHNSHRYYSSRRHHHRHHDSFPFAAGIVGFALGSALANSYSAPAYYGGNSQDAYCARKYRSYDPYSNTFMGYDGRRHYCRIP